MREKIKRVLEKNKQKAARSAIYVKFLQVRDKTADYMLNAILAFSDAVSPVWTFLFVKTPEEPGKESGQTDTKSFGSLKICDFRQ